MEAYCDLLSVFVTIAIWVASIQWQHTKEPRR